jgi:internalin A
MEVDLISRGFESLDAIELDDDIDLAQAAVLNLHDNRLESLRGLPEISRLVELNLSSNLFSTCDLDELTALPSLRSLDLSGNRIVSLETLPFLPSVRDLAVAFNGIRSLDGVFNLPNLESLDCRGNVLCAAADCMHIQPLGRLRAMWLSR